MNLKEANKFLKDFTDSIETLQRECAQNKYNVESKNKLIVENNKMKDELKSLKIIKQQFVVLQRNSNVKICPNCNGDGGFYWDMGEQGGQGEECGQCESLGVVSNDR